MRQISEIMEGELMPSYFLLYIIQSSVDFLKRFDKTHYMDNAASPMKTVLTILVAYGSYHIGARIIHRLSQLQQIEIVGQARDVESALSQFVQEKPKLVILDALLSQGAGLGVLRSMKAQDSGCIVIMTSASNYPQYRKQCIKEGADYFFYLPDDIDSLCQTVAELGRSTRRGAPSPTIDAPLKD